MFGCPFKDIFGKPGEGVHSVRFLGLAAVDLFLTLLVAFILALIRHHSKGTSILQETLIGFTILIFISALVHWIFCVDTPVTRFIIDGGKGFIRALPGLVR